MGHGKEDTSLAQFFADPVNRTHYWTNPAANEYSLDASGGHSLSLGNLITFAEQQGKTFAIGETGAGNAGNGADVLDDPTFPQWLASTLQTAQSQGLNVAYVNIWDTNQGGTYEFSNAADLKPQEAAAWAKYFGVQSTTTTATATSSTSTAATSTTTTTSTSATGSSSTISSPTTSSTSATVVGSGSDVITLVMSEDYYAANAQFLISVDGKQVGGTQTATAIAGNNQSQLFYVEGNFGTGTHTVSINYLNDSYGGAVNLDRNLYVLGASYNGTAAPSSSAALLSWGTQSITVGASVPGITYLGTGSSNLQLTVAEQAFSGDAQFTISVDGVQIGGTQTVTADKAVGESQIFNVAGTFGAGVHDVSINLVNPYTNGLDPLAARTISVTGATINGSTVSNVGLTDSGSTPQSFTFGSGTSNVSTPTEIGSGPDKLDLFVSETNASNGAQFVVMVDGQQVGGTQTTAVSHSTGQSQEYEIQGNFTQGSHAVSIDYLNASGASQLNLETATINGNTITAATGTDTGGWVGFNFTHAATPTVVGGGSGSDTLALNMSEDFYASNAQFTVAVDGKQLGGVQTAAAIHGDGQSQVFDFFGNLSGSHNVTVSFLNDAYGGSSTLDSNLYVTGATVNGTALTNSTFAVNSNGSQTFSFTH